MKCPNKNHPVWKALVKSVGTKEAYKQYILNGEEIPTVNNSPAFDSLNLRDYRIEDLTLDQQDKIVNIITSNLLDIVDDGTNVKEAFNRVFDRITNSYEQGLLTPEQEKIAELVLDNFDGIKGGFIGFSGLAAMKLASLKISIKDDSLESEEGILENRNFSENATFKTNPKSTASYRLKRTLSFIPVVDKEGNPVPSILGPGTYSYYDFDALYSQIMRYLADHQFKDMIPALEELSKAQPQFKIVMDRFLSGPKQDLNEFLSNFKKRYSEFKVFTFDVDTRNPEALAASLYVRDSNRLSASQLVADKWKENFKNSKYITVIKEEDIQLDQSLSGKLGAVLVNTGKGKQLRDQFVSLVRSHTDTIEHLEKYVALFAQLGIDLNVNALWDLDKAQRKSGEGTLQTYLASKAAFIFSRLAGAVKEIASESEDTELLFSDNNPFGGKEGSIDYLARFQAKYEDDLYSASFRDVKGNSIFAYNNPTHMTDQLLKLTDYDNEEYIKQLMTTEFASTSTYAQELLDKESDLSKTLSISYFDAGKRARSGRGRALEYSEMSEKMRELTRVGLLQNQGKDTVHIFDLTFSDKPLNAIITAPRVDVANHDLDSSESMTKLYKLAEGELRRIILSAKQIKAGDPNVLIEGYHTGYKAGAKFFLFPSLNGNPAIFDEIGEVKQSLLEGPIPAEVVTSVLQGVRSEIDLMVADKKATWKSLGIFNTTSNNLFDKSYLYHGKNGIRNKVSSEEKLLDYAALDYVVNYAVTLGNMIQLIHGDVALAGKKNQENTLINYHKRLAKDIAPGIEIPFEEANFNTIFFNDVKTYSVSEYTIKFYKQQEGKNPIEGTDAQEVTTVKEHVDILWARGLVPYDSYKSILSKIEASQLDGTGYYELTKAEIEYLQPMKPVHVNMKVENGINKVSYIKTSSYPLLPQLTKGTALDKLRLAMEKNNNLQRAVFVSGVKLGIQKASDLYIDGKIREDLDTHVVENRISLPREGFKIQQDNPIKGNKILQATQQRKNLFTDLEGDVALGKEGLTRDELKKKYDSLHSELLDKRFEDLLKRFGITKNDKGEYDIKDYVPFYDMIEAEAAERGWSPNEIAALQLNEDKKGFKIPLMYSAQSEKIESLLTAIINSNIVNNKLPGHSYIQASSIGHEGEDKNVFKDPSLRYMVKDTDGTFFSETAVAWPYDLSYEEYVNEDGSPKLDKFDEKLLYIIGYRIPNQGHNSMLRMKIKRFLPKQVGDLMLVPSEVTLQMGSDFDVDKMNSYMFNSEVKDGKLVKTEDKNSKEGVQNQIIDINHDVLGDEKVIDRVQQPLGFENLAKEADRVDAKLSKGRKSFSILHDKTSEDAYVSNKSGKLLTALTSLSSTNHALAQEAGLYVKNIISRGEIVESIPVMFLDEKGNLYSEKGLEEVKIPMLRGDVDGLTSTANHVRSHDYLDMPDKGAWRLDKVKGFSGRRISQVISELQSAAVDNAKEQVLGKANLNKHTYAVAALIARVGFDETFIVPFLRQEAIESYVDAMEKLGDPTVPFASRKNKEQAIEDLIRDLEKKGNVSITELKALSREDMDSTLGVENKDAAYYAKQAQILYNFIKYDKVATQMSALQSALNPESSGIGKSLSDVKFKQEQIDRVRTKSPLLGNVSRFFDGTFVGNVIDKSVYQSNEIFRKLFPYFEDSYRYAESAIATEMGLENAMNTDLYDLIHRDMKASIFTSDGLIVPANRMFSERERLMIDRFEIDENGNKSFSQKSLAQRLSEYKGANKFLRKLSTNLSVKSGEPSYVIYQAAKSEDSGESLSNAIAFQDALEGSSALDKELAEDLVKYSYLTGGVQSATSFAKYIPTSYIVNELKLGDNANIDFTDKLAFSFFIRQFFQHNPTLAKELNPDLSQLVASSIPDKAFIIEKGTKKIDSKFTPDTFRVAHPSDLSVANLLVTIDNEHTLPTYIHLRKGKEGVMLYEKVAVNKDGETQYARVSTLGNPSIREYNITRDVSESIISNNNVESSSVKKNLTGDVLFPETHGTVIDGIDKGSDLYNALTQSNLQASIDAIGRKDGKFSALANYLADKVYGLHIQIDETLSEKGRTIGSSLSINPAYIKSQAELEDVVLEETIHGITASKIQAYEEGRLGSLSAEELRAIRALEILMNTTKARIDPNNEKVARYHTLRGKRDSSKITKEEIAEGNNLVKEIYGIVNLSEFVQAVLTKEEFQKTLNHIEFTKDRTILQRFFDLIQSLLGIAINRGSVLEHSLIESINLIENVNRNEEGTESNYSSAFNKKNGLPVASINRHFQGRDVEKEEEELGLASWIVKKYEGIQQNVRYYVPKTDAQLTRALNKAKKHILDNSLQAKYEARIVPTGDGGLMVRLFDLTIGKQANVNLSPSFDDKNKKDKKTTGDANLDKIIGRWENQIRYIKSLYVGSPEERDTKKREIEDLEAAINKLITTKEMDSVFERSVIQLKQVKDLLEGDLSIDNIKKAHTYLSGWSDIGDIFSFEDDSDEQARVDRIVANATKLSKDLKKASIEYFISYANQFREGGNKMTKKDFEAQVDTDKFHANFMDSSVSSIAIEQEMDRIIKDTAFTINEVTKAKHEEIAEKAKKANLKQNANLLLQRYRDGKLTGNLISKYQQEYYDTLKKLSKDAHQDRPKWKEFIKFMKDNSYTLTKEEIESGKSKHFTEEEIKEAKSKLGRYDTALDNFKKELRERVSLKHENEEGELMDEAALETEYQEELSKWEHKNSPYLRWQFEEEVSEGLRKERDLKGMKGYRYITSKPKESWEDSNYKALQSKPELLEFYNYFKKTVAEASNFLPGGDDLQSNTIPELSKSLLKELMDTKGKGWFTALGDAIKNSITVEGINDTEYGIRDEATGATIRQLRAGMTGSTLDASEKSYDLENVLKAFVDMATTFKYKSMVQDKLLLGESLIMDLKEQVTTPEGTNKVDYSGNPIKLTNGLNNTKERAQYLVDSFFGNRKELELVTKEIKSGALKGKRVAGSKIADNIIQLTQVKGLGLNPFSGVTNLMFGLVANMLHSSGGTEFNDTEMLKAVGIMMKGLNGKNKIKIASLMEKLQVLGDMNQANYGSKSMFDKTYFLQKMGEHIVQGQVMIAMMLHTKVKDINGIEKSLWDAYKVDKDGKLVWDTEKFGESEYQDKDTASSTKTRQFSSKIQQTVKYIHGNYDINSPIMIKKSMWGRLLMVFRSWIPYAIENRFGSERYDYRLDRKIKGRWKTFNILTGGSLGHLEGLKTLLKLSLLGKLSGQKVTGLNETDLANMKANLREVSIAMSLYLVTMMMKGMLLDDDDDEMKPVYTYWFNAAKRVDSDLWFFASPKAFNQIISDPVPPLKTVNDLLSLFENTGGWVLGNDEIKSGRHKGDSKLNRSVIKTIPLINQVQKTMDTMGQVYQ